MNSNTNKNTILEFKDFSFYYPYKKNGKQDKALDKINLKIHKNKVTVIIGASGCGKSTLLWSINRLNELKNVDIKSSGQIYLNGNPIYDRSMNTVKLRKKIGLVFQKPAPFPLSIYENIVFALKINDKRNPQILDKIVEDSLKKVNLWDEVKDRLHSSAFTLSGGQQQRLCIARCLANEPEIILMDEPTSALDPISKVKIEELIFSLKKKYTIILVTHSLGQASKISDYVVFLDKGKLVEFGITNHIFLQPKEKKTWQYITGKVE